MLEQDAWIVVFFCKCKSHVSVSKGKNGPQSSFTSKRAGIISNINMSSSYSHVLVSSSRDTVPADTAPRLLNRSLKQKSYWHKRQANEWLMLFHRLYLNYCHRQLITRQLPAWAGSRATRLCSLDPTGHSYYSVNTVDHCRQGRSITGYFSQRTLHSS